MTYARRTDDLVVEQTDDETLVYDLRTDEAHCLDAMTSRVWDASGAGDLDEVAAAADVPEDLAAAALARLAELGLLEVTGTEASRRDVLKRLALVGGAAAVAGPLVRSLQAPEAAQAATLPGGGQTGLPSGSRCTGDIQCQSGSCIGSTNELGIKNGRCK